MNRLMFKNDVAAAVFLSPVVLNTVFESKAKATAHEDDRLFQCA